MSNQIKELEKIIKNKKIEYCFFRGQGGSGKTYTIAKFIKKHNIKSDQYIFVGPTGKSVSVAEDKGLYGHTIHKFFGIYIASSEKEIKDVIVKNNKSMKNYYNHMRFKLRNIKYVFIDEVSMVEYDILIHMLRTIKHVAPSTMIIMAGDYHQLPPVSSKGVENSSIKIIEELYYEGVLQFIDFYKRYRSDNKKYNDFITDFRDGKIKDVKSVSRYLENFFNVYKKNLDQDIFNKLTFLYYKNSDVNQTNHDILENLPGKEYEFTYEVKQIIPPEKAYMLESVVSDLQMDKLLKFKINSKIIFRVNALDDTYKNGEEGIIENVNVNSVVIKKLRTNTLVKISKHNFTNKKLTDEDITNDDNVFIEVEQFPFSLGNARTIHKAQGDGFYYMHIDLSFLENGRLTNKDKYHLLYVVLSRVIEPDNVYIKASDIKLLNEKWALLKDIKFDELSLKI